METNHAGTWILNFKPLELWGKKQKFLLFKIPSLCYFIRVTTYSAAFPFKLFWAVYYLAQILSFTCRNWNIKILTYNYFLKNELRRNFSTAWVWVMFKKTDFSSGVFPGNGQIIISFLFQNEVLKKLELCAFPFGTSF